MQKSITFILIGLLSWVSFSQNFKEQNFNIPIEKDSIYGTLLTPSFNQPEKLVIIIPGSGPTDRNGNQAMMQTNSLKFLAEQLSNEGIATYRFDKSMIHQMTQEGFSEAQVNFDDFVADAKAVIDYFANTGNFDKIIVAGHSQGSLVGLLASADTTDAYISLCGPSESIDVTIVDQINKQLPDKKGETERILSLLKKGETATDVDPGLMMIFRPSVQPFMISWMKYVPKEEIKKLSVPILIVGGTKDMQVPVADAEVLNLSAENSQLLIVENMNHIFKIIEGNELENQMSYINPELPVSEKLVEGILKFISDLD